MLPRMRWRLKGPTWIDCILIDCILPKLIPIDISLNIIMMIMTMMMLVIMMMIVMMMLVIMMMMLMMFTWPPRPLLCAGNPLEHLAQPYLRNDDGYDDNSNLQISL